MTFEIDSIKYKLGEIALSVENICQSTGKNYERLVLRSGFEFVHRTLESEHEFFTDFLARELEIRKGDYVILVNQSMDALIPGKVSTLFANLGDARNVGFFEISDGCTGFARALIIGNAMLESGLATRVHIVCGEKYSRFYDNNDESVSPIFSDAISATTLTSVGRNTIVGSRIANFFENSEAISVNSSDEGIVKIHMEGARVLNWATREIPKVVSDLLQESNLSIDEIDSWYVHQGSKIVVESIMDSLGVDPVAKFTASHIGNTVSSTIPIMLKDGQSSPDQQFIPEGYAICLAFGVGLSIVAVLLKVTH